MSLFEQDNTRKKQVDENNATKLDASNSKEYKVEIIWDSAVYTKESEGYLPGFYYLLSWKGYLEEKNT